MKCPVGHLTGTFVTKKAEWRIYSLKKVGMGREHASLGITISLPTVVSWKAHHEKVLQDFVAKLSLSKLQTLIANFHKKSPPGYSIGT